MMKEILEVWLPTKLSRWIATVTILLAVASTSLPRILQEFEVQLSKEHRLLLLGSLPLLTLWIGTFIVLLLVVQYSKNLKTQKQPTLLSAKPKIKLPQIQESILFHLYKNTSGSFIFQIVQLFDISEDIAKFHLEKLQRNSFVAQGLPFKPGRPWHVTDKGTKYLIENKLIS